MATLPLPPPDHHSTPITLDDFRDGEVTACEALPAPSAKEDRAQRIADLATSASRVESLISAAYHAYDDMSSGRVADLRRKSQRVTDMLTVSRDEARKLLELAYAVLAETQR